MQIVHIDHRNALLEDVGRKIVVRANGHRKATIPMRLVERLVVSSTAKIATSLLIKLNQQGTGVLVLPSRYRTSQPLHIVKTRLDIPLAHAQLAAAANPATAMPLATRIIDAKLRGHRLLLEELAENRLRHRPGLTKAAVSLSRALESLAELQKPNTGESGLRVGIVREERTGAHAPPRARPGGHKVSSPNRSERLSADKDRLRGIEGAASAQFFRAWGRCFPPVLKFSTRNRRPPLDPVNVCLSIGYTLAHHEALIAACTMGLDPQIGFLHDPLANRDSLACDIVEPTRPVIDRWVHQLFHQGELRNAHFSTTSTSCMAGKAGRKLIYNHYFENTAPKVTAICTQQARWLRQHLSANAALPETMPETTIVTLDEQP